MRERAFHIASCVFIAEGKGALKVDAREMARTAARLFRPYACTVLITSQMIAGRRDHGNQSMSAWRVRRAISPYRGALRLLLRQVGQRLDAQHAVDERIKRA